MAIGGLIKKAVSSLVSKKAKEKSKDMARIAFNIIKGVLIKSVTMFSFPILIIALIIIVLASIVIPTIDELKSGSSSSLLPTDDNYIVKTDEEGAAPAVSLSQLEDGIKEWLKSHKSMKENALKVAPALINAQNQYKVNAVFLLAVARVECGIGANSKHGYNWWSFGIQDGYSFDSPEDCVNSAANGIANGSYYFTKGIYTVNEIGEVYCPDSDVPGQSKPWQKNVRNYMTDLYEAMGITTTSGITGDGDILNTAKKLMDYAREHNMKYNNNVGKNIPLDTSHIIDCSSYVSWVLYECGYERFKGPQKSSSYFLSNSMKWQQVKESELQPGDILAYGGHVEIYAGNNQIYSAGSDRAIQREQPYKRTRKFQKAFRPPGNK